MVTSLTWASTETLEDGIGLIEGGEKNAVTFYQKLLGDDGIVRIAAALRGNRSCMGLSLQGTGMGDRGLRALGEVLNTTSISWLSISDNDVTAAGMKSFTDALKNNTTLTELHLHDNPIGNEGAEAFVDALQYNFTLLNLYFAQCKVTREDIRKEIKDYLTRNRNMEKKLWEDSWKSSEMRPWRRAKLMVVGQGRAGKSCTVRSLLGQDFNPNMESTIGACLTKTESTQNSKDRGVAWQEQGEHQSFAARHAAGLYLEKLSMVRGKNSEDLAGLSDGERQEIVKNATIEYYKKNTGKKISGDDGGDNAVLDVAKKYEQALILKASEEGDAIRYSIWDYGGQEVFYTLHHLFLTRYGMYMVVFNMRELLDNPIESKEYLSFWLNSITMHAPEAPIMMVGTFLDKVKSNELKKVNALVSQVLGNKYPQVVKNEDKETKYFFPVNNTNKATVAAIRSKIETVTREQDYVNTMIKISWMAFLDKLLDDDDKSWYSLRDVKEIASRFGISSSECDRILELFHELGILIHLTSTENLRNVVTTNPQWLIDSLSKVIRDQTLHKYDDSDIEIAGLTDDLSRLTKDAILSRDLTYYFWGHEQEDFLLDLMRRTLLLSDWEFGEEGMYLVPSLLRDGETSVNILREQAEYGNGDDTDEATDYMCQFDFSKSYLPTGIFQRLVCLWVNHSSRNKESKEPVLSKSNAKVWYGDRVVYLRKEQRKISLIVHDEEFAKKALSITRSMLWKIKQDVMGEGLNWDVNLENAKPHGNGKINTDSLNLKRNFVPYDKAKKMKLSPWFEATNQKQNRKQNQKQADIPSHSLELNSFLDSL